MPERWNLKWGMGASRMSGWRAGTLNKGWGFQVGGRNYQNLKNGIGGLQCLCLKGWKEESEMRMYKVSTRVKAGTLSMD